MLQHYYHESGIVPLKALKKTAFVGGLLSILSALIYAVLLHLMPTVQLAVLMTILFGASIGYYVTVKKPLIIYH